MTQVVETFQSIWDSALLPPEGTNELKFFDTKEVYQQADEWCDWFLKEFGSKLDEADRKHIENKCIMDVLKRVKSFEAMEIVIDGFTKKTLGPSIPLYYQLKYGICTEADREPTNPIPSEQLRKLLIIFEGNAEAEIPPRSAMIDLTINHQTYLRTSALRLLSPYCLAVGIGLKRKGITMMPEIEYDVKLLWKQRVPFGLSEFRDEHVFIRVYLTGIFRKDDDKGKE